MKFIVGFFAGVLVTSAMVVVRTWNARADLSTRVEIPAATTIAPGLTKLVALEKQLELTPAQGATSQDRLRVVLAMLATMSAASSWIEVCNAEGYRSPSMDLAELRQTAEHVAESSTDQVAWLRVKAAMRGYVEKSVIESGKDAMWSTVAMTQWEQAAYRPVHERLREMISADLSAYN